MVKCPGQDQRFWKPKDIFEVKCPDCKTTVEFWKDEPSLKCKKCKKLIINPKLDLGCAKWCKYAKQCLGVLSHQDNRILCDRLIGEMEQNFADDEKRVKHALKVLDYAEKIHLTEGGDPLVVKAAAILHEIDNPEEILTKYGLDKELIENISQVIASRHSAKNIDTIEFKIVCDAYWLTDFPQKFPDADTEKIKKLIDNTFKTEKGRQLATEMFT